MCSLSIRTFYILWIFCQKLACIFQKMPKLIKKQAFMADYLIHAHLCTASSHNIPSSYVIVLQ